MRILFFCCLLPLCASAQPNCNVYLYEGDTLQYRACVLSETINDRYYQFTREFQMAFDEVLAICPYFAYAYSEKSVAYLKSGDFITWKQLIDQAVLYDAKGYLGYRGWCRYQFFRDYTGAIADIERLDSLLNSDIGYSVNGDYHLNFAKALCYSALGQKQKAIDIMENQLLQEGYAPGLYDYYQLGVTYFQINNLEKAQWCFEQQSRVNELAENAYYWAKLKKQTGDTRAFETIKAKAIDLYNQKKILNDPYTEHLNKVYLDEIKKE